ncbi:MAG TPA: hypothetical protein DEH15_06310 [Marinilabiliales bacterium]|nr:hypothetical protein [Marinilabiliales bacterium]HBY52057.1 hypothetical protein [Marinilabiliales bacterium]
MFFILCPVTTFPQLVEFLSFPQEGFYLFPQNVGNHNYKFLAGNYINTKEVLKKQPFRSVLVSGDYKLMDGPDRFSVGGTYYFSRLTGSPLIDQKMFLTFSYRKVYRNNQFLVGIQPGLFNSHFDAGSVVNPDQYDRNLGGFNPDIPTFETFIPFESQNAYSLNFGGSWTKFYQNFQSTIQFALRNMNQPDVSVFHEPYWFYRTYLVSFNTTYHLTGLDQIQCDLLNSSSELLNEFMFSGILTHRFSHSRFLMNSVFVGNQWAFRSKKYPNDIIFNLGVNLKKLSVGVGYSFNFLSGGKKVATYNTFEFSLQYRGIYEYDRKFALPCKVL